MLRVNLWDKEFAHSLAQDGFDTCSHLVKPTKIEYVRNQMEWDGITLFTNNCLDMVDKVKSKVKDLKLKFKLKLKFMCISYQSFSKDCMSISFFCCTLY